MRFPSGVFSCAVCFALLCVSAASVSPVRANSLDAARLVFEDSVASLKREHAEEIGHLQAKYVSELDKRVEIVRDSGDLDGLLRIQKEKERVAEGRIEPLPESAGDELIRLRALYRKAAGRMERELDKKIRRLALTYQEHLERLERARVRENRIEDARVVRREKERIEEMIPPPQSREINEAHARNGLPEGRLRIKWNPRVNVKEALLATLDGEERLRLKARDDHRINLRGIQTNGKGATTFGGEEEAKLLQESVKASNAFTLAAAVETEALNQSGPARILSCSKGTMERNFTLGQDGKHLVLRLRTTRTGPNGTSPQIRLGELTARRSVTVVYTYDAEEGGRLYRDGKEASVRKIGGNFSNWSAFPFYIGNESSGKRGWSGTLKFFELHNRALSREEALQLSRRR